MQSSRLREKTIVKASDGRVLDSQTQQEYQSLKKLAHEIDNQRKEKEKLNQSKLPFNERELPFTAVDIERIGGEQLLWSDDSALNNVQLITEDDEELNDD